jgi:hypothetical protein
MALEMLDLGVFSSDFVEPGLLGCNTVEVRGRNKRLLTAAHSERSQPKEWV